MKKLIFSITSAIGLSFIASPALATFVSDSGKTTITSYGSELIYFSQVGSERIVGRAQGKRGATGYFNGSFTDYSSNGDVCQGSFILTSSSPSGQRNAVWNVHSAAPGKQCSSIGQEFSTSVQTQLANTPHGVGGTLIGFKPMERISVLNNPSDSSSAHSYGLPGDRIWIHRASGSWYKVKFQSGGTTGWIHRSKVSSDDFQMNQAE